MSKRPTDAELAILHVLWARGPSTVRQVLEEIKPRGVGYTTVLKLLQIMTTKGLVQRDENARSHVYRPAMPQEKTQTRLVGDLIERAFGGSVQKLLVAALSNERASAEDLEEIRMLVESELQSRKGGKP